jgi:hypothetical protein
MSAEERYEKGFPWKGIIAFLVALGVIAGGVIYSGALNKPSSAPLKYATTPDPTPTPKVTPTPSPSASATPEKHGKKHG